MTTALVLAGTRAGAPDRLAAAMGVSHKALIPVGGVPMLARVLDTLRASPRISRIVVSAEQASDMLAAIAAPSDILARVAQPSPARSVAAVLAEFEAPLLVTTADHPLLSAAMVEHALAASDAAAGVDALAAVACSRVVLEQYPDATRTWLRFRDGDVSGCNLFVLCTTGAAEAVRFWQTLEDHRKQPWTMARLVGPFAAIAYAGRWLTLSGMLEHLGKRAGARLGAIDMPFAEAAIDVDKPADLALAEAIIAARA